MENQQQLIKFYFSLLVHQFIYDPRHRNYYLVFKKELEKGKDNKKLLGWVKRHYENSEHELWRFYCDPHRFSYKYEVQFLIDYRSVDELREVVVYEFTHLYLFSTIGDHEHDDNFYS